MLKQSTTSSTKKKVGANKLVMGFAALAATAVIGTTGIAAAAQNMKPSHDQCVKAGFSNYGQCVSAWAHAKAGGNGSGHGYGGNSTAIDLNLNVNGSNNVITVILNFFR
jgi:hypothetical protein